MKQSQYLIFNGEFYHSYKFLISPDNRSFRYGDGFFETMKMIGGNIILAEFHFERLLSSLPVMQFDVPDFFTPAYFSELITALVKKNNHRSHSRIRLTIFRGEGTLYDTTNNFPNFIIQSGSVDVFPSFQEPGYAVDIYPDARKAADVFSHIKNNNYLPYAMAAVWSRKKGLNDALLMNSRNRVMEATTSNLFLVKQNCFITPPLTEGCIAGVVRRHLITCLQKAGMDFEERAVDFQDIQQADEMFLTNAGWYIQWVKQCGSTRFGYQRSKDLYEQFITPLIKEE